MASDTPHNGSVDRRSFLAASAAGAVVAAAAPQALATAISTPLSVGTDLGSGWTITEIGPAQAGSIRIVAAHAATSRGAAVAVCKAEAGSRAMASTDELDLFLMNDGGDGRSLTPDDEVEMVQRVAQRLQGASDALAGADKLLGRKARQLAYDPIDHLEPLARH